MIARDSLEKSLPRLASAAPFLCLIEDHLLCPDKVILLDQCQKSLVDARVVRELGMEGRDDEPSLAQRDGLAVELRQHFDLGTGLPHPRRADEDAAQRLLVALQDEIGLEAGDLAPVGVPV